MPQATVGHLHDHARGRLALRDARTRTGSRTSPSTCSSRARSGGRPRATSAPRSTGSAASSTPSPARSTPATTSSARPSTATSRSTCSSTCSATRSSTSDEIEREKGVIVEEMNMYYDTPRDFIGGVYDELLYGDQPLGWDIIGTQGDRPRGRPRHLPRLHRPLVQARAHGRRPRRQRSAATLLETIERAARRPRARPRPATPRGRRRQAERARA